VRAENNFFEEERGKKYFFWWRGREEVLDGTLSDFWSEMGQGRCPTKSMHFLEHLPTPLFLSRSNTVREMGGGGVEQSHCV
jgi:hypothetical protein